MTTDEKIAILESYGRLTITEYSDDSYGVRLERVSTNQFMDFFTMLSESVGDSLEYAVDAVYKSIILRMWSST